jgi:hypothetical protein
MADPLTRASADLIETDLTLGLGCHVQLDTKRNELYLDSTRPVRTRHEGLDVQHNSDNSPSMS